MQRPLIRTPRTWLAYLALGYYGYLINGLGPAMPFLRENLHLSYAEGSLHSSAFALGMLLAGLVGDRAVQHWGRSATMVGGLSGLAAGSLLLVVGRSIVFTLGGAVLMGSLGTLVLVLVPALLADEHGSDTASALNEVNVVSSICGMLAPLVIGGLAQTVFGWRVGFVLGALLLIPIAYRLRTLKQPEPTARSTQQPSSGPLPRAYWAYWLLLVCCISLEFTTIFWTADFLHTVAQVPKDSAAALVSVFLGAMVIGRFAGSRLTRIFRARVLLLPALGLTAVGFLLYWLVAVTLLRLLGLFVTGIGIATLYPLSLALALDTAPGQSALASARATLASATAVGVSPLVLGGLADHVGIDRAYSIVGVLLFLAIVTSRVARRAASVLGSASSELNASIGC